MPKATKDVRLRNLDLSSTDDEESGLERFLLSKVGPWPLPEPIDNAPVENPPIKNLFGQGFPGARNDYPNSKRKKLIEYKLLFL